MRLNHRGIATRELLTIDFQLAAHQMHIGFAGWVQRQCGGLITVEQTCIQPGIRMDRDRTLRAVTGCHQPQSAAFLSIYESFLLIAWCDTDGMGLNPDLKDVCGLALCMVELAVLHACACTHALNIAGRNTLDIAHAVFVRQFARQHIADDFHVFVAMGSKAPACGNVVFIDHAQVAKAHVCRVVITSKRKRMLRLEPAVVSMATLA